MGCAIVITSGKGGVGKTTTTANLGTALAALGKKVVVVDGDTGLRNLDVLMGLENRIVYTIIDVIENRCRLKQALIKDKRYPNLCLLPTAQTKDKDDIRSQDMFELVNKLKEELLDLPGKVELVLEDKDKIKAIAEKMYNESDMFYLGRGLDYAVALEGSLKLKEISYIHSEAYAGGELKHGPIALIEDGTEVITLLTQEALKEKMVSNVVEIKARGAKVTGICYEGTKGLEEVLDEIIYIPRTLDIFAPVLSVAVLQLFSYYVAKAKGCDIDKPRNLAKSVTVE